MNTQPTPQNAPPAYATEGMHAAAVREEDDFELGWECANPALQIEVWGLEATAQPLQRFA